ncbi:kinase-like domain-containing protein [Rhizophagus irregularis DAOM 181602=DAOM 197198]|nr:kinase-like domain-containing protein [Rhizophagus irregularis DAOM 181602=DAOM 197198]
MLNILMKEDLALYTKLLDEFLKEWEYHMKCLVSSSAIIEFYGFTKDPNTSKYMVVMDYANKDLKSLDENTSENLNEILESEDLQASVKVNETLVSENLDDYIIKDLESLDENNIIRY